MYESRISYLCAMAARGSLSLDQESELLGYIVLDPELLELIVIELLLLS